MANSTSHLYIDTKAGQLSSIYYHLLYGHGKNSWRDSFRCSEESKEFSTQFDRVLWSIQNQTLHEWVKWGKGKFLEVKQIPVKFEGGCGWRQW